VADGVPATVAPDAAAEGDDLRLALSHLDRERATLPLDDERAEIEPVRADVVGARALGAVGQANVKAAPEVDAWLRGGAARNGGRRDEHEDDREQSLVESIEHEPLLFRVSVS